MSFIEKKNSTAALTHFLILAKNCDFKTASGKKPVATRGTYLPKMEIARPKKFDNHIATSMVF